MFIRTTGASAGDPKVVMDISGVTTFCMGLDNSDSDKFKIGWSSAVGTNTFFTATTAGDITCTGTITAPTFAGNASTASSAATLTTSRLINGTSFNGSADVIVSAGINLLYNGDFKLWQRGVSFACASTTVYTADRWQGTTTANTATFSRQNGATSGSYVMRVQRNNAITNTTAITLIQSLTREMAIGSANNIVTLSFWARKGANFSATSDTITVKIITGDGTTDVSAASSSFGSQTNAVNTTQVITSTLTKYTFSTSALGSAITQLAASIGFVPVGTAGAADYFEITDIQLEVNPVATNFQRISYAEELQRCQYFYQLIYGFSGYANSTTQIQVSLQYTMRIIPTVSASGVLCITDGAANYIQSSFVVDATLLFANGGLLFVSNFTGMTQYRPCILNPIVNNNYLTLSAELA